jgi:hypothetical protein
MQRASHASTRTWPRIRARSSRAGSVAAVVGTVLGAALTARSALCGRNS